VLVENSTYERQSLKRRLFSEGLKERRCEMCGQGESWRGARMALVLDHVNGIWDDNRLENLRIVCPNCNATLETHCGRKNQRRGSERSCERCGATFYPRYSAQRFCSRECGSRHTTRHFRRVERPPYSQLRAEIAATSYRAVGRKYGVSDNAIRKWVRAYERDGASAEERAPPLALAGVKRAHRRHPRAARAAHAFARAQRPARDLCGRADGGGPSGRARAGGGRSWRSV
jgi:transposase-like protein